MPPQGIYFIYADESTGGNNGLISPYSEKFSAKIDDRGRITLPSGIRRNYLAEGFSFSVMLPERIIIIKKSFSGYALDSRGRLFLPADIRRSLGFDSGSVLRIMFAGGENV